MNILLALTRHRDEQRRATKLSSWERYRELLGDVVADANVDFDEAAEIISANNKTDAEFAQDVKLLQNRIERRKQFDQGVDAQERVKLATLELQRLDEQIATLHRKLSPKFEAAHEAQSKAERDFFQAEAARDFLLNTAMNPAIKLQIDALTKERSELGQELRETNGKIDQLAISYHQNRLREAEHSQDRSGFSPQAEAIAKHEHANHISECKRKLKEQLRRRDELTPEVGRLEKRIAEINSQIQTLSEENLIP